MASNLGSETPRAWSEPAKGGLMHDGVLRESGLAVGMARDRGAAMLGATGRVRIFEFERATARWVPR